MIQHNQYGYLKKGSTSKAQTATRETWSRSNSLKTKRFSQVILQQGIYIGLWSLSKAIKLRHDCFGTRYRNRRILQDMAQLHGNNRETYHSLCRLREA